MSKTIPPSQRPVVLTVAGSDNSAGAGAQADLKTFSSFGCYGLTAITCVVAEVPGKVSSIQAIRAPIVAEQMALNLKAFPVAAAKTGMLYSAAIIEVVADTFSRPTKGRLPLVIDPVMVASSGDSLLKKNAVAAYRKHLFPLASLVTPNLDELKILARQEIRSLTEMREAGRRLVDEYGCPFLLKGGHLRGKVAVDILMDPKGAEEFSAPFIRGVNTHGTGCTYAAAVAANLALGKTLSEAVRETKAYISAAISQHLLWGSTCALEHFPDKSGSGSRRNKARQKKMKSYLSLLAAVASMTICSVAMADPLEGRWEFDLAATENEIRKNTDFPDEAIESLMTIFLPHQWVFEEGRYSMFLPEKTVTGTYVLEQVGPKKYRVRMTCSENPAGDRGEITFSENHFVYGSAEPLFDNCKTHYKKIKHRQPDSVNP